MMQLQYILMPLFLAAMVWKLPAGPLARFVKAGAVSEATARRPNGVGVTDMTILNRERRIGLLIPTGDGRFYVNMPMYRRRRRRVMIGLGLGTAALAGLTLVTTMPEP